MFEFTSSVLGKTKGVRPNVCSFEQCTAISEDVLAEFQMVKYLHFFENFK